MKKLRDAFEKMEGKIQAQREMLQAPEIQKSPNDPGPVSIWHSRLVRLRAETISWRDRKAPVAQGRTYGPVSLPIEEVEPAIPIHPRFSQGA